MTNLAENLTTTTSQGDLARELQRLRDAEGVTFAAIANKTGISRSAISQLVNQGLRMKPEHEKKLWDAVNEIKGTEERLGPDVPVAPIHFKTRIELFETKEFKECMGWCNYVCSKRKMGVMVGHPGSGKTTVLRHFAQTQPGVLYIEAWPQMRVGDMLEAIARPLGLSLRGNNYRKTQDLIAYLSGRTDVLIAVDEAEYLAKWDVDKFEVLRKVWDNTGTPVILCGTDVLEGMLTRGRGRPRQPGAALPPQGGIEAERHRPGRGAHDPAGVQRERRRCRRSGDHRRRRKARRHGHLRGNPGHLSGSRRGRANHRRHPGKRPEIQTDVLRRTT